MDMKPNTHEWVQLGLWLDQVFLPAVVMVGVLIAACFV
jgi:hypothetical protein